MISTITASFILPLLAVSVSGKSLKQFDVVCRESQDGYAVFVPHPYDCSLYYECVDLTPVLMSCPPGLNFDSRINVCNWPEFVVCPESTTTTTKTSTSSSSTTTTQETEPTETTSNSSLPSTTESITSTTPNMNSTRVKRNAGFDVVCRESQDGNAVFVPHPYDCSLYYECVDLTPVLMSCPPGLNFDSRINVCNWPEFVVCPEQTTTTTTTSSSSTTTTQATEPTETTSNSSLPSTTESITSSTPNMNSTRVKRNTGFDVVCRESQDGYAVFVPHPYDCSLYYECVDLTPVLMSCPPGLNFDSRINVCNWPEFVVCPEQTTTTTTTTASTTESITNSPVTKTTAENAVTNSTDAPITSSTVLM